MAAAELTCLADVARTWPEPLEQQIVVRLRAAIAGGQLGAGVRVPPSRRLAGELGLARNTVAAAYEQLVADGYLIGAKGAGTFVARGAAAPGVPDVGTAERPAAVPDVRQGLVAFSLCQPASSPFPLLAWRRAFARAASRLPGGTYGDPAGERRLRDAVASYLNNARALPVTAAQVVVTAGAAQAIALLARALLRPGDTVALEEPGYPVARRVFSDAGARLLPIPVNEDGLVVAALPDGPDAPRVVYVTPSHQFPLGVRLSLPRRHALLAWAARNDAVVIEDDYDGEFRYDAAPLPPLASLPGSGQVAYVGTFSKTLTPALRLGYVVAEPGLVARLVERQAACDDHPPAVTQHAVASLIEEGVLSRHVARMRRIYAARRAVLQTELEPVRHLAHLKGLSAGLHVCLHMDGAEQADRLCAELRRVGLSLAPVSAYAAKASSTLNCVVFGYGAMEPASIRDCCARIRAALLQSAVK